MAGRTIIVLAVVILLHAAYSSYEHLSQLKALGRPEGQLPHNIILESLLALLLGIIGAALAAPPLKDISWSSEMRTRTIDDMDARLGFADYTGRGRMLFGEKRS